MPVPRTKQEVRIPTSSLPLPTPKSILTTHNRGIPHGYLSALETRLIQTEAALFSVLSRAQPHQPHRLTPSTRLHGQARWTDKQQRADRVGTWERLPLETPEDIHAWFQAQQAVNHDMPMAAPPEVSPRLDGATPTPSDQFIAPENPWEPPSDEPAATDDGRSGFAGIRSSTVSKAAELSKSQQRLYF